MVGREGALLRSLHGEAEPLQELERCDSLIQGRSKKHESWGLLPSEVLKAKGKAVFSVEPGCFQQLTQASPSRKLKNATSWAPKELTFS